MPFEGWESEFIRSIIKEHPMEPVTVSYEDGVDMLNGEVSVLEFKLVDVHKAILTKQPIEPVVEKLGLTMDEVREGMKKFYGIDI